MRRAARSRAGDVAAGRRPAVTVSATASIGLVGVLGRPAEPDQPLLHLVAPGLGRRDGTPASGRRDGRADPVLELEDDPLGALLADAGHRGQGAHVVTGDRAAYGVRREDGEHRLGQLRADAAGGLDQLEDLLLVVVGEAEQGQGVLADHHRGRQRRGLAGAQGRQRVRRAHQLQADAAHLEDGAGQGEGGDLAADERDHRPPPPGLGGRGQGGVDAGLGAAAPDVGDRQRQRVGGVGRLGRRVEPQDAGHHRADLGLVRATAAGDRGLDLARRVQRDRQPAPGRGDHGDAAGLGGAHDRAGVGAGEDPLDRDGVGPVLVEPGLDAALDVHQPHRDVLVGGGAQDVDVDQPQRPTHVALDHAHAAPGQPGVDPQHAHAVSPSSEHLFARHAIPRDRRSDDTRTRRRLAESSYDDRRVRAPTCAAR